MDFSLHDALVKLHEDAGDDAAPQPALDGPEAEAVLNGEL
jgi:hypothetical protein